MLPSLLFRLLGTTVCLLVVRHCVEKIQEKWEESAWAKKLAKRAAKASMNDFQRFSAMIEKRKARAVKA